MIRRIAITGVTGFVGRHVIKHLATQSVELTLIVRSPDYPQEFLENVPHSKIINTPDLFNEGKEWWQSNLEGIDTLLHLAWVAEPGEYLYSNLNVQCVIGTLQMLEGARLAGVQRVVGIGSCLEYEMGKDRLSVDTPLKPETPYAAAKVAVYHFASQFLKRNSIEFLWCRLFYLYGDGEDHRRLIPYIREKLRLGETAYLGDGSLVRDYLDVSEAARRITVETLSSKCGSVNICSGKGVSIKALAESVAAEFGREDLLKFNSRTSAFTEPQFIVGA